MNKKFVLVIGLVIVAIVAGFILLFSEQLGIYTTIFNKPPIIDFYDPSDNNPEVIEGNTLTFSASASDPDGDIITYSWKLSNEVVFEESLNENYTTSSWVYYPELGDRGEHLVECTVSDGKGGYASVDWTVIVHFIELEVVIDNFEGEWIRDPVTDLPAYESTVSYSVSNLGDITASNVELMVFSNGGTLMEKIVSINSDGGSYSDQFYATSMYDSDTSISLQASCGCSSDSYSFEISAKLDRWPVSPNIRKLYITPYDSMIQSTVDEIFAGRPWWDIRADWKVILDWIKNEIDYEYDEVLFNERDYWQLPRETLVKRKGDCEDQAILLCSLLRARGYKPDELYVILGYGEDSGHAWVTFKLFDIFGHGIWRYLEPTSSGWYSDILDLLAQVLGLYESEYGADRVIFNDQIYEYP